MTAGVWVEVDDFFFFSSRRRHTRWTGDWSSTCALPISGVAELIKVLKAAGERHARDTRVVFVSASPPQIGSAIRKRSEERRVGKECRSRWSPDRQKKKEERGADTSRQRQAEQPRD